MTPVPQSTDVKANAGAAEGAPMAPASRAEKARAAAQEGLAGAPAAPADGATTAVAPADGATIADGAKVAVVREPVKLARARVELLCDPGTFHPHRTAVGDGVIAGSGKVAGRPVYVWAQDGTFKGGSLGMAGGTTIVRTIEMA